MVTAKKNQGQAALLSTSLLAFYRRVSQSLLTVVDVETTGSVAYKARVIEVSVLQATLADGILQQETYLINPRVKIPPFISQMTGITHAMVGNAPPPEEVWANCADLLQKGVLTAHNFDFDYGFLQSEYKHVGGHYYRPPSHQLCTVQLSRLLLADLPSRSLPNLVKYFQFDVGPSHRAEADTKACWLLAQRLLTQIQTDPEEQLLTLFRQQWVRLREAAALFECRKDKALQLLCQAGAEQRLSKRSQEPLFRRGEVEDVFYAQQGEQLTVL